MDEQGCVHQQDNVRLRAALERISTCITSASSLLVVADAMPGDDSWLIDLDQANTEVNELLVKLSAPPAPCGGQAGQVDLMRRMCDALVAHVDAMHFCGICQRVVSRNPQIGGVHADDCPVAAYCSEGRDG